jgi:hypothetical protein
MGGLSETAPMRQQDQRAAFLGEAGLCPARAAEAARSAAGVKEGAHGGTMGSPVLNQLLRIEEEMGDAAVYPGWDAFPRARR